MPFSASKKKLNYNAIYSGWIFCSVFLSKEAQSPVKDGIKYIE